MGENILKLQTDATLLENIKKSLQKKQSASDIAEQRVSFVFGSLDNNSVVTRERVRRILADQGGVVI